jgi:hypothetical protein
MCNPNTSVANRRYRHAALQSTALSSSASLLTQKLMGSMVPRSTSNCSNQGAIVANASTSSRYNAMTQPVKVEPMEPYEASFCDGYEQQRNHQQQPMPQQQHHYNLQYHHLHPAEKREKPKRRRKPQKPGLTAKVRRLLEESRMPISFGTDSILHTSAFASFWAHLSDVSSFFCF